MTDSLRRVERETGEREREIVTDSLRRVERETGERERDSD